MASEYKVLIVEDEMLVRVGLRNSIDWAKFGMLVIADVSNGQEAWEIYKENHPDLIITDLKMPVMSGMKLIEKIRENDTVTKIVILTCHDEFELARKAISLGVLDYILKLTMSQEEIEDVLNRAVRALNNQNRGGAEEKIISNSVALIKENIIMDYLFCEGYSSGELEEQAVKLKLRISPERLIVVAMYIGEHSLVRPRADDISNQYVKKIMLNMLEEILKSSGRGEAVSDNEKNYIIIFSFSDICSEQDVYKELFSVINRIKKSMISFFNSSVSFGVSSVKNGYSSIQNLYKEALMALDAKFLNGAGTYLSNNDSICEHTIKKKFDAIRHLPKLGKMLNKEEMEEYNKRIDSFLSSFSLKKELILGFFLQLTQWITVNFHTWNDDAADILISYNLKIQYCDTIDLAIEIFKSYISDLSNKIIIKKVLPQEILKTIEYIQDNYQRNISLQNAADFVGLNPSYLSSIFKLKIKVSFVEYLNDLRIEKAKDLLRETYLKSYEISEYVGFSDASYFSKVFKKVTGTSPNDFRKLTLEEWTEDMENEDL